MGNSRETAKDNTCSTELAYARTLAREAIFVSKDTTCDSVRPDKDVSRLHLVSFPGWQPRKQGKPLVLVMPSM